METCNAHPRQATTHAGPLAVLVAGSERYCHVASLSHVPPGRRRVPSRNAVAVRPRGRAPRCDVPCGIPLRVLRNVKSSPLTRAAWSRGLIPSAWVRRAAGGADTERRSRTDPAGRIADHRPALAE